ncbi:LPS export ABC transporter permease LptG [Motiliproteus sediminis]|uniref:LPS export ABC transporter permease LptG n=1 Tax=Motiliproteus sediminis TaxID=1468178 RepID=UPI001AEFF100|nr:LPS export ABC transporter permease LptG [Motiliproteus sediminis]
MNRLDRYIGSTVLSACLLVLLLIVSLDSLFALIDNLSKDNSQHTAATISQYLLLTLPGRIYEFSALALLVGCLAGLGFLASSSELTVLRAAGVSKLRILGSVMQPVLLLVALVAALGELVIPVTEPQAEVLKAKVRSSSDTTYSQWNLWHREGDWYINANAVESDGTLHGVTRYRISPERQLLEASYARLGHYRGDGWDLKQVSTTYFDAERTRTRHVASEVWQIELRPELLRYLAMQPINMSVQGLASYSDYLDAQGVNAGRYRFALWNKLLMPVAIFGLVLIATSFVFGSMRSVTLGQRIMVGVMVGLLFKFSQDLLGPASLVFGFSPMLAALTPISVCVVAGALMLRRAG